MDGLRPFASFVGQGSVGRAASASWPPITLVFHGFFTASSQREAMLLHEEPDLCKKSRAERRR